MSKVVKRQITVNGVNYFWTLKGNRIDEKPIHIKVHIEGLTKSILYLDPYDWSFKIRPYTIRRAILFALEKGWMPEYVKTEMIISMKNNIFFILPKGKKFGYELDDR